MEAGKNNATDFRQNEKDMLSAEGVRQYLHAQSKDMQILAYNTLDSTNRQAKQLAAEGACAGTLVLANHQTEGRGRMGRSFFSPSGTGLYLSLVLRPVLPANQTVLITAAAAVAVCKAIEGLTKKQAQIKWVNDIFINGKKVCGILSEAALHGQSGMADFVVLGIGVNVLSPAQGFPDALCEVAGCLFDQPEKANRNRLAAEIVNAFMEEYKQLAQGTFMEAYRARCMVIGKDIAYTKNNQTHTALVLDVDEACRLKVRREDGTVEHLSSGEISLGSHNLSGNLKINFETQK